MSTIDMTQVAGLQAVDAEGNVIGTLSVNDLTELVANNLVKSTQNQVFAARSVSTMSEASTLAVSDEYENNLPIDANPASVRTLDSEGNPKQTAISALAQVVGGLLNVFTIQKAKLEGDLNKGISPGIWVFSKNSVSNGPSSNKLTSECIAVSFCLPSPVTNNYQIQLIGTYDNIFFIRWWSNAINNLPWIQLN